MKNLLLCLITVFLILIPARGGLSQDPVQEKQVFSLEVEPRIAFRYNGQGWATVRFSITLPEPAEICTGWAYPAGRWVDVIYLRRSCRKTRFSSFTELWGGAKYPFPQVGHYYGFLQYGEEGEEWGRATITDRFEVLEGIPYSR